MPDSNIKTLYTFTVLRDQLVDETITRDEPDPANPDVIKTISETRKVNKPVPTYFAFKRPSRTERELAEEERAVWWSRYVEKGLLTEALLLKTYSNAGGILSEDDRKRYTDARVQYGDKVEQLYIIKTTKAADSAAIATLTGEMIDLRDQIIRFEQEQSTFFENTAEAKARVKLSEHLVLTLSYTRDDESKSWVPYLAGATPADRAARLAALEEAEDPIFKEAYPQLVFLAAFLRDSGYQAKTEDIDEFLKTSRQT